MRGARNPRVVLATSSSAVLLGGSTPMPTDPVVNTALVPSSVKGLAPAGPCDPVDPVAPVAPVIPIGPCGPVAPVAPVAPAAPVAPVAPSSAITLHALAFKFGVGLLGP